MKEYDSLSINIIFNLSWQNRRRSPVGPTAKRRSSTAGDLQEEQRPAEAYTKVKCKDSRATFNVGASSNPAKFSKLLKNIENYIQKTYKDPDDMVKTIQKMKKMSLSFPETRPKKTDKDCCDNNGDPDPDAFDMAVFVWKEDLKSMKLRMDKYKGNESNAWALIYDQRSPELKNKLKGTEGYNGAKSTNNVAKLLTMIRGYCCRFDLLSDEYMAIVVAIKNLFYPCSQRSKSLSLNIE